ncbi:MAG TPA: VanZ family protein [Candidatus Tectomicrobia bacterium]|nr:VanZ family protein [Candidatus Tectomicrobia bacterium]
MRWIRVAALLYAAVILLLTVTPQGRLHAKPSTPLNEIETRTLGSAARDATLNVLLFVPLGILLRQVAADARLRGLRALLAVVTAGCAFSLGIEVLQFWLPLRFSSWLDVVANTAGAWVGAGIRSLRA